MSDEVRPALLRDTVLVRAPDLGIVLAASGKVRVGLGQTETSVPAVALSVLAFFERPATVAAAIDACAGADAAPERVLEIADVIILLHRAGALRAPEETQLGAHGFSSAEIHISMLQDRRRTDAFCGAVRAAVRPTDTVVEIGTGTGILSVAAAHAGARHVHAIEASPIADVAQRVAEANGVADRVSILRARSNEVVLPEKGDLLIAELIGNAPMHEAILETVLDARRRLLKIDARFIPARIEVLGIPVAVPRALRDRHRFSEEAVEAIRQEHGIDLSPFTAHRPPPWRPMLVEPSLIEPAMLGEPAVMVTVELARVEEAALSGEMEFVMPEGVEHLGLAVSFRADLGAGIFVSPILPDIDPGTSWLVPVFSAPDEFRVAAGATVKARYEYRRHRTDVTFTT